MGRNVFRKVSSLIFLMCFFAFFTTVAYVEENASPQKLQPNVLKERQFQQASKRTVTPREAEEFRAIKTQRRPLTQSEIKLLDMVQLPPVVDYSKYVTLIRNQDFWGGCGTMSSIAILDILKEKEYPYAPDFSYRFAEYIYNNRHIGQLEVLEQFGDLPEASFPTNYDIATIPPPSNQNYNAAKLHLIDSHSDWITKPPIDKLKQLLVYYGPLFASGDVPGSPAHAHIFTIIGYDDNTQEFTIVNSYGDQWGTDGMIKMPYSSITNPPPTQTTPRVDEVMWVKDKLINFPRPDPYTARIRIKHNIKRNFLTVKIGVEGKTPMTVWDRPNQVNMSDNSKNLVFDFPLPSYAYQFWPPNEQHLWYLEVTDSSSSTASKNVIGVVDEVTLVNRRGSMPVLYRSSATGMPIPEGGTTKIYIPSKKQYKLSLTSDHPQVIANAMVQLGGTLTLIVEASDLKKADVPQANREVKIYETKNDLIEQTIITRLIQTATTDNSGKYSLNFNPSVTSSYVAIVAKPDGTVEATSNIITIKVQ